MSELDYTTLHPAMTERLIALARSLSPAQWTSPSLCTGWRVCDVYGHMTYGGVTPMRVVVPRLLFIHRGNLNKGSAVESVRYADAHPQAEMIERFAHASEHPVGIAKLVKPDELFVDHVVHELDIRRPLGLASVFTEAELVAALAKAVRMKSPLIAPVRNATGLRFVATDVDWSDGVAGNPTVEGPSEDLLLALCGRPAGLAALHGSGLGEISRRLGAAS